MRRLRPQRAQPMSSVKHMAVLNALHLNGPQDYLALERILGMSGLTYVVGFLSRQGLIDTLPKKAKEMRKYKVTDEGLNRIGKNIIKTGFVYEPLVLVDSAPVRPGAMDAYKVKSLSNQRPTHI